MIDRAKIHCFYLMLAVVVFWSYFSPPPATEVITGLTMSRFLLDALGVPAIYFIWYCGHLKVQTYLEEQGYEDLALHSFLLGVACTLGVPSGLAVAYFAHTPWPTLAYVFAGVAVPAAFILPYKKWPTLFILAGSYLICTVVAVTIQVNALAALIAALVVCLFIGIPTIIMWGGLETIVTLCQKLGSKQTSQKTRA